MRDPRITDMEPSIEEQKNFGNQHINKELEVGDKWYLISSDWFCRWASYVGIKLNDNDVNHHSTLNAPLPSPGKINNRTLFDETTKQLKNDIVENVDFQAIPEQLWDYLKSIFSITNEDVI